MKKASKSITKRRIAALLTAAVSAFCTLFAAFPAYAEDATTTDESTTGESTPGESTPTTDAAASIDSISHESITVKNVTTSNGKTYANFTVTSSANISNSDSAALNSLRDCIYAVEFEDNDDFTAENYSGDTYTYISGNKLIIETRFRNVRCYENSGFLEYCVYYRPTPDSDVKYQIVGTDVVVSDKSTTTDDQTAEEAPHYIIDCETMFTIAPGEKKNITLKFRNINKTVSSSVLVSSLVNDNENIDVQNASKTLYNVGDFTVNYSISASSSAQNGKYPATITLFHTTSKGVKTEQSYTIYFKVEGDSISDDVSIVDYSVSKSNLKVGDKFNLSVTVENKSGAALDSAVVELTDGIDGSLIALESGVSYREVSLKNGEKKTVTFPLIVTSEPTSLRAIVGMSLKYNVKGSSEPGVFSTNAYLSCYVDESKQNEDKEEEEVLQPNIIITNYDFGGDYVIGGQVFPLSIDIKNASNISDISNLKITIQGLGLADKGAAYSPANSSNTFFIEKLGRGQTTSITLDLLPKIDAAPDSYPVEVTFTFEYMSAGKMTNSSPVSEEITIPLQQEDRFSLEPSYIESSAYVGSEAYIGMKLVNKGKSPVYNVSVEVVGEGFSSADGTTFIGNVESGKEEYYDTRITPEMPGLLEGQVVVTYEDANGTEKTANYSFTMDVMEMMIWEEPIIDEYPVDGGEFEEEGGIPLIVWILIGAGVVVVGIIVTVVCVKKAKQRKLRRLEEEDEDI